MPKQKLGRTDAMRLLMEGQEALSQVESNGMRIDTEYANRMMAETQIKLDSMEEELKRDDVWKEWKKVYGDRANLDSNDQLGDIIFDKLKVPCEKRTASGKPSTDEEALERVKFPFIQRLVNRGKLYTARNTFLNGICEETVNGFLHPSFSLAIPTTYRSSASLPNSQNWPIRILRTAMLIRQCFIPRDGHTMVEFDLASAEVRVSCCYHRDPTMMEYIGRNHDYHKDLAMQCYKLSKDQVTKPTRGAAKGGFVFASFYGDYYVNICQNLWNAIDQDDLKRTDGLGLKEHLAQQGITELGGLGRNPIPGTFEAHIKGIYEDFWNRRFPVYSQWKIDWWEEYLRNGYCESLTGFVYRGINKRNEIINYPIQGSSFHCLLWTLIQVQKWLNGKRMRSKIIGQIHDSIILDIHLAEFDDVIAQVYRTMTVDIRREWPWLIVPLEAEASRSDVNWFRKEEIKLQAA